MHRSRAQPSRGFTFTPGFTLVELLAVVGVVAVLLAMLMPAISGARAEARAVQCTSNVRQIALGLLGYAGEHRGRFPPNLYTPAPGQFWCDDGRRFGGAVLSCPADDDGRRSYAMNVWASSRVDTVVAAESPPRGRLWSAHTPDATKLILVVEAWSGFGNSAGGGGWEALPTAGYVGRRPGQRFGAGGGLSPPFPLGRFGAVNCELPYARHRRRSGAGTQGTQPRGRVSIAYADGHAQLKGDDELADQATGKSTGDSLWSPLDPAID